MPFRRPIPLDWRTVILRVLFSSATICLISSIVAYSQAQWYITVGSAVTKFIPLLFIILHHLLRLWPRGYWSEISEILCSLIEIGCSAFVQYNLWAKWFFIDPNFTGILMMGISWSVLSASSFAAFLILLWDVTANRGKNLLRQYDFSAGLCRPGCQWNFIFGSSTIKKRFETDNRLIRWLRGGLAMLCLIALSFMMFYVFVGQPLWWGRHPVIRTSRAPTQHLIDTIPGGRVQVVMDVSDMQYVKRNVPLPLLNVTATISAGLDSSGTLTLGRGLPIIRPAEKRFHRLPECLEATPWQEENLFMVSCPLINGFDDLGNQYFYTLPLDTDLEIIVTVNYSAIANTSQDPFKIGLYTWLVGSGQAPQNDAKPVYLRPGSHFYALSSVSYRERIWNRGFAALGVPKYRLYPVLNIGYLFSDSLSPTSENNTASLRLFIPYEEEVQVEREYFENSILNGFALIGGIWTFVNGLFASVFGTTLLLILFGIKPLSVYGLVHSFLSTEGSLMPRKLSAEDREWIIEVLSEHLLDDNIRISREVKLESDITEAELQPLQYGRTSTQIKDSPEYNSSGNA